MVLQYLLVLLLGVLFEAFTIAAPQAPAPIIVYPDHSYPSMIKEDTTLSALVFPNGTVAQAGTTGVQNKATLEITLGTERQHVGFVGSRNLPLELSQILDDLCDPSLVPGNPCRTTEIKTINKIAFTTWESKNWNDVLETAFLNVRIESAYIPQPPGSADSRVLLTMFKDQIVKAFSAAIYCKKNQYQKRTRRTVTAKEKCSWYANSADFYQVAIRTTGASNALPHMKVKIWFNGVTAEGIFDCIGTQASVWNDVSDRRLQVYAAALQMPVQGAVTCGGNGKLTGDCYKVDCLFLRPDCRR